MYLGLPDSWYVVFVLIPPRPRWWRLKLRLFEEWENGYNTSLSGWILMNGPVKCNIAMNGPGHSCVSLAQFVAARGG